MNGEESTRFNVLGKTGLAAFFPIIIGPSACVIFVVVGVVVVVVVRTKVRLRQNH